MQDVTDAARASTGVAMRWSMQQVRRAVLVFVAAVVVLGQLLAPQVSALAPQQSIMMPAYSYPMQGGNNQYWNDMANVSSKMPFAVVNPSSGPGTTVSSDYVKALARLDSLGVKYIGYVKHGRQTRNIAEVAAEIDRWYALYPNVKGIFFDEADNHSSGQKTCYLANLYNYVKVKHPGSIVIHNAGTRFLGESVMPYGDVFLNAETSAARYLSDSYYDLNHPTATNFEKNPANAYKMWHVIHSVGSNEQQAQVVAKARERNAGWVYTTSDRGPTTPAEEADPNINPYNDSSTLLGGLAGLGSIQRGNVPVGAATPLTADCADTFGLKVTAQPTPAPAPAPKPAPKPEEKKKDDKDKKKDEKKDKKKPQPSKKHQQPTVRKQEKGPNWTIITLVAVAVVLAVAGGGGAWWWFVGRKRRQVKNRSRYDNTMI